MESDSGAPAAKVRLPGRSLHFGGGNSSIFQTLGLLHPRMRTVMLTHEFLNKRNHVIPVTVGRAHQGKHARR